MMDSMASAFLSRLTISSDSLLFLENNLKIMLKFDFRRELLCVSEQYSFHNSATIPENTGASLVRSHDKS